MIKAIIFDMDGVLVKTIHIAEEIAREKLSKHNICITKEDIIHLSGFSWKEFLEHIYNSRNIKPIKGLYEEILIKYSDVLYDKVILYENADLLLKELSKKYTLALVSGSSKKDILTNLNKFKIKHYFKLIISAEEVNKGKPAPDLYLSACEKLNLKPYECIGIEDSVLGVESVINAGIKCIAITHTVSNDKLKKADLLINNLGEVIKNIKIIEKKQF
jgi:HAD superfamily hydrolase (TIGR01509 family)